MLHISPKVRKAIVLTAILVIAMTVQFRFGVFPAFCVAAIGLAVFDKLRPKDEL